MFLNTEQVALIGQVFESYVQEHHKHDIVHILQGPDSGAHYPIVVNAMTLFEINMEIGEYLNAFPNEILPIFDNALRRASMTILQAYPEPNNLVTKQNLHARISGLPICPELTRDHIPKTRDVGHFLSVMGTVIRTGMVKVLEFEHEYMCNKCRHVFPVYADFEQFYTFCRPTSCPNEDDCNSTKFTCLSGSSSAPSRCKDYQEIKIQEQVQRLTVGSIPRSLLVVLEDDLVDTCKSGDDVTVYGVVMQRWKPLSPDVRCDLELVLKANYLVVNNEQPTGVIIDEDVCREFEDFWAKHRDDTLAGRNEILASICPQVFGMYLVKLAVAMVLAGGVQKIDAAGTKVRGEPHLLLVGDPGTGKSQFLKYAVKIVPRSVLTAGIGSTSAGLTVTAVKDSGEWNLEAGALVLADGGLCCIDEFNSIKEHDRASIHEAMEQQTISVAKAGLVCKLNTRTTVLAATNPKGQYDIHESIAVNTALASPLLSRFDLVIVLLDTKNEEWDKVIASFILENKACPTTSEKLWSMEKMKTYFCLIKTLQPRISSEADTILVKYYQLQRQSWFRNAARTTIRMLESLVRLAEAHARLMFRDTVTIEDAITVVSVMESSMQGGALLGGVNALHTSFPENPAEQYRMQCELLLERLGLHNLLQKELEKLDRIHGEKEQGSPSGRKKSNDQTYLFPDNSTDCSKNERNSDFQDIDQSDNGLNWFDGSQSEFEPKIGDIAQIGSPTPKDSYLPILPETSICPETVTNTEAAATNLDPSNRTSEPESFCGPNNMSSAGSAIKITRIDQTVCTEGQIIDESCASSNTFKPVIKIHGSKKLHSRRVVESIKLFGNTQNLKASHMSESKETSAINVNDSSCTPNSGSSDQGPLHSTPAAATQSVPLFRPRNTMHEACMTPPVPETNANSNPLLAKLKTFEFKQKPKLSHSVSGSLTPHIKAGEVGVLNAELSWTSEPHVQSSDASEKQQRTLACPSETRFPHKTTGKSVHVEVCGGAELPLKSLLAVPKCSDIVQGHVAMDVAKHPVCTKPNVDQQNRQNSTNTNHGEVSSNTLAKLAKFSFSPPPERGTENVIEENRNSKNVIARKLNRLEQNVNADSASTAKKRKTFRFAPTHNAATIARKYLFSTDELDDDDGMLDFDWNEESKKKPRA
uniref:DNA helicase MCM9 n=1 Tax=Callorhinchus milii TaxID=7868 RepID=A0A4W3HTA5_CALMI|eukprot:gi/632963381/ref/XP_007897848.1/ PREDICTED: DNA helicase MCM9 [Callorhinchus milii]